MNVRDYMVPVVVEQDGRSERSFDIYSRLLRERIIFCTGTIEDGMANVIVAQLLFLEAENSEKPISLYVNSGGGSVSSGHAIISTMNFIKPAVHTVLFGGTAASMGAMILTSGAKGHRYALPRSRIMLHQPSSGGISGMQSDIEISYQEITKIKKELTSMLVESSGRTVEELEKVMDRDTWFNVEEALEFGLIDQILTRSEVVSKNAD